MKIKKVVLTIALLCCVITPAFAFSITEYGPMEIHLSGWGVGREYAPNLDQNQNIVSWTPEDPSNSWFQSNDPQGLPNANATTLPDSSYYYGPGGIAGDGIEDSWGLLRLDDIKDYDGNTLWSKPSGGTGQYVTGIFYGFDDINVSNNTVYHSGGVIELYELTLTSVPSANTSDPNLRSGNTYTGYTGLASQLLAKFTAVPLNSLVDYSTLPNDVTRKDTITSGLTSLPSSGTGVLVLDVVPGEGSAWQYFNGNAVYNKFGQLLTNHDLVMQYTYLYSPGMGFSLGRFDSTMSDPGLTFNAVPEPSTMWLLGMGLLGVIPVVRRKKAA